MALLFSGVLGVFWGDFGHFLEFCEEFGVGFVEKAAFLGLDYLLEFLR
jgi:hypothetical protein